MPSPFTELRLRERCQRLGIGLPGAALLALGLVVPALIILSAAFMLLAADGHCVARGLVCDPRLVAATHVSQLLLGLGLGYLALRLSGDALQEFCSPLPSKLATFLGQRGQLRVTALRQDDKDVRIQAIEVDGHDQPLARIDLHLRSLYRFTYQPLGAPAPEQPAVALFEPGARLRFSLDRRARSLPHCDVRFHWSHAGRYLDGRLLIAAKRIACVRTPV